MINNFVYSPFNNNKQFDSEIWLNIHRSLSSLSHFNEHFNAGRWKEIWVVGGKIESFRRKLLAEFLSDFL